MKTTLLILTLFAFSSSFFAQENRDTSIVQIVPFPDVEAEFPDGTIALMKYITQSITYPEDYIDIDVAGKIYVSFFVNIDGSVSDVKVERGTDKKLDEMAIKLILDMPRWKPAEIDKKVVKSKIRLPITILLE